MHCVAGDGVGILAGAVVASYLTLTRPLEIALEYGLGVGFGWTIFQALFMRDMAGGSYRRALATTFLPEFLSMNLVMTGMMLIASLGRIAIGGRFSPLTPEFWFVMSMALLSGFLTAYPINWWLVAKGLKHGMMTVRHPEAAHDAGVTSHATPPPVLASSNEGHAGHANVSRNQLAWMTILSVATFVLAFVAQDRVKALIDGLPLSSINRAVERIEHGDVASRTALPRPQAWISAVGIGPPEPQRTE